ncbi:TonB-dependent receptor [Sphingomonas xanthus]|uniref:TonB-dependent siderophore receptor n=1 Tax=Sphingomonas xanthus TaxID=2594473 RepID=A0A516IQS0_9SPHN|nr:TonB-dependent siderophore receptor [Sphingomonas xanthus]QDP19257.1 TonB-dependent siderophore receptor [Sphingomonas xanthus]
MTAPAVAAETLIEADGHDIIVIGERGVYGVTSTSTATKTDTPLEDVPQSISVITAQQIADQSLRSVGDVLRYVPGTLGAQGEGHRDQIVLRGNNSTADFFVDGFRDDVQYYRGLYNLERVEVLKGPNAMIFGRGGGGGVVNRVSKRATDGHFARGAVSADLEGAWYVEGDANMPLGRVIDGRVNGVYEEFDNFRDVYEGHRFALNPTIAIQATPDTRIDLGFEYARDRRVIDRGVPSDIRGRAAANIDDPARPLDGFDETFFGDSQVNRSRFTAKVFRIGLEHRFNDQLRLSSKALYGDYDKLYQNAYAAGPARSVGGVDVVAIEAYRDPTRRENILLQNDLVADFATGPLRHTLLLGADFADQQSRNQRINGFFDSGVATSNGGRRTDVLLGERIAVPPISFRDGSGNRSVRSDVRAIGIYVQDQVKLGDHVEIIAGLRRDWFDLKIDNLVTDRSFARKDRLWSPRLGLVLKPIEALSFYASFARSFLPQSGDQFNALDVTLAALKPERFTNLEVGAKWQPMPGLDVTLAAYRLDRTNTRETDPLTLETVLTGEQRSKGVELEVRGDVTRRLSVSGGIAIQDVEIRKSAVAAMIGREAPLVPEFQASLWGRYDFSDRFGAGLGVYHQSRSFASISNAVVLPAYTRVDAAGYFTLSDRLGVQVNVENLLGEDYYANAHNDNNITPGAPRTVRATLRFGI